MLSFVPDRPKPMTALAIEGRTIRQFCDAPKLVLEERNSKIHVPCALIECSLRPRSFRGRFLDRLRLACRMRFVSTKMAPEGLGRRERSHVEKTVDSTATNEHPR